MPMPMRVDVVMHWSLTFTEWIYLFPKAKISAHSFQPMASFYHFYHLTFTEWISLSSLHTPFSQCHHFLSFSLSGSLSLICSADSAHSFCIISMICDSSLTFTEWSKNICTLLLAGSIKNTQTLFIWRHQNQFALSQIFLDGIKFWLASKPIYFYPV